MRHLTETSARAAVIAATLPLLEIEVGAGIVDLAKALEVEPPQEWPPEDDGDAYLRWMTTLLRNHPDEPGGAAGT